MKKEGNRVNISPKKASRKKRAKYSRNGCLTCKRKKVKCDETTPICSRCARLHLKCVYSHNYKFQSGLPKSLRRNNAGTERNFQLNLGTNPLPTDRLPSLSSPESSQEPINEFGILLANQEQLVGDILAADQRFQTFPRQLNAVPNIGTSVPIPTGIPDSRIPEDTLNMLIHTPQSESGSISLSDIYNGSPSELNLQDFANSFTGVKLPKDARPTSKIDPAISQIKEDDSSADYDFHTSLLKSDSAETLSQICISLNLKPAESMHFKSFVKNDQLILNPFASTYLDSAFIKVFIKNARSSTYLLNAMLACGARYLLDKADSEYKSISKSNGQKQTDIELKLKKQIEFHGRARTCYLSNCFRYLKLLLEKPERVQFEVESALLTSLLLTADLSSYAGSNWSVHLSGARQLLKDYVDAKIPITPTVAIAKYLFSSLELSDWLAVPKESELPSSDELNRWLPIPSNYGPQSQLSRLGLTYDGYRVHKRDDGTTYITPEIGTFKVYMGFTDDSINIMKQIILARHEMRDGQHAADPLKVCEILGMISNARNFFIMTNKAPYKIPLSSKYHPLYEGVDKSKAPLAGYYHVTNLHLEPKDSWFSYFDFCSQIRVDALHIYMLCSDSFLNLDPTSEQVRRLFNSAIKDVQFLIRLSRNLSAEEELKLEKYYNSDIVETDPFSVTKMDVMKGVVEMSRPKLNEICQRVFHETLTNPIDYSKYLSYQIDHRICMVQSVLMLFGYCCVTAEEKILIECMLMKLLRVGTKSGKISLERLNRIWTMRRIRYKDPSGRIFRLEPDFGNDFFFNDGRGLLFT